MCIDSFGNQLQAQGLEVSQLIFSGVGIKKKFFTTARVLKLLGSNEQRTMLSTVVSVTEMLNLIVLGSS